MKKIKIILIFFFISTISEIKTQICGNKDPKNLTDCNYDSYEDQACCFLIYNKTIEGCLFIPQNSTFITPYVKLIDFGLDNLFSIDIDCGKNEEKNKRLCGDHPKNATECLMNSNVTHDCCFFQTPAENHCLWNDRESRKNSDIISSIIENNPEFFFLFL